MQVRSLGLQLGGDEGINLISLNERKDRNTVGKERYTPVARIVNTRGDLRNVRVSFLEWYASKQAGMKTNRDNLLRQEVSREATWCLLMVKLTPGVAPRPPWIIDRSPRSRRE